MKPSGTAPSTAGRIAMFVLIVAILTLGCGGKGSREESSRAGSPDTSARTAGSATKQEPAPALNVPPDGTTSDVPSSAKSYGYDQAGEYVRDLQERVKKINDRLDEIDRVIRATDVPQTAEMEARMDVLRSIVEDIGIRSIEAENTSTEREWPVWEESLEKEMANLQRGAARLDSMVTAVRRSP